ncbi:MAG: four helix bundle protein [Planctomycetaceae bacterium]
MSRDPEKLDVFKLADELVLDVYRSTSFPVEERFGLQSQIRRATVSVPANIVEGCSRYSERDYLHFMTIALGSASEARYLLRLAFRLGFVDAQAYAPLQQRFDHVVRSLQKLITTLRDAD